MISTVLDDSDGTYWYGTQGSMLASGECSPPHPTLCSVPLHRQPLDMLLNGIPKMKKLIPRS